MDATNAPSPTIDSPAPTRSSFGRCGLRDVGTRKWPATIAAMTIGTLTMNTEPHQKCSSRKPPVTGPSATAMPATPDHSPMASARSRVSVKTLVRIDSVAGMISAAPMPMTARAPMSASDATGERRRGRRPAEHDEADGQRALAAEPVTEAAGGEEQAGEHERVRVDHPLQVADARAEVADERRQRHVDDRVVDHDHQQAHAEDRERGPAPAVHRVVDAARRAAVGRSGVGGGEGRWRVDDVAGVGHGELLVR